MEKSLLMCKCGKPFVGDCRYLALQSCYVIDQARLSECQTVEERVALMRDPSAKIKSSNYHGPIII